MIGGPIGKPIGAPDFSLETQLVFTLFDEGDTFYTHLLTMYVHFTLFDEGDTFYTIQLAFPQYLPPPTKTYWPMEDDYFFPMTISHAKTGSDARALRVRNGQGSFFRSDNQRSGARSRRIRP